MDPPDHGKYRVLLAPVFSPKSIDSVERSLYDLSAELIDAFADKGECEFMTAYARTFPVIVFMRMMGMPMEDRELFVEWEHQIFQGETAQARMQASAEVAAYMRKLMEVKRRKPEDDILSKLVRAEVDGAPIRQEMVDGMVMLLFMAGLDTVAAGLGHTFRYLAEHPDLQARLRAHPELISDAVEESLRYHTWVPTGRLVVKETDFHGARMMPGDWVQTVLYRASNDPKEADNPHEFIVPREPNRHFAFGSGVHRCAGSHLARREMRIGVRMMLERTGQIRIKPGARLRYDGGFVCLGALPLEWEARA
jgi:cytochrome P450